jgi:hypothetical protein
MNTTKTSYAMKYGYHFLFHSLLRLSINVYRKYKNKIILIKYSRPIGMFPATHRLRITDLHSQASRHRKLFYSIMHLFKNSDPITRSPTEWKLSDITSLFRIIAMFHVYIVLHTHEMFLT